MTADRDGPPDDRDCDGSRCASPGAEPVSLQLVVKSPRMRSSGKGEPLRRLPAGYGGSGHRGHAMHRQRRAIGRPHWSQRTAPRAVHDVPAGLPVAHRRDGAEQASPAELGGRRLVARSLAIAVKALRSPYFGNIGVLILLCVISFHPCFDLAKIVSNSVLCLGAKAAFAATVNLVVNDWTPTIQAFLAGRLLRWIAFSLLLALLPVLTVIRAGVLAKVRSLASLMLVRLRGVASISLPLPKRFTKRSMRCRSQEARKLH